MAEARVTQAGLYIESPYGAVLVTQAGVYVEMVRAGEARVTQAGLYVESPGAAAVLATQMGVYAELIAVEPMQPTHHEYTPGPRPHTLLPEPVTGYALDRDGSFWSVVVPEETVNYIRNPSFEGSITWNALNDYLVFGWQSHSVSNERVTGGFLAAKLVPIDTQAAYIGIVAFTGSLATPLVRTFSCDIYQNYGDSYEIRIQDSTSALIGTKSWRATYTGWYRPSITYLHADATGVTIALFSHVGNTNTIYTDRWQLENKAYPTTYADGDMRGFDDDLEPYAYAWQGFPHESYSERNGRTRSGGRIVSLNEMKLRTIGITGLGMGPVDPQFDTVDPGERLRQVLRPGRDFTIVGKIFGCRYEDLQEYRQQLVDALRPRWLRSTEPLLLHYHNVDSLGRQSSPDLEIAAVYRDGLGLSLNNLYQETLTLNFRAPDPVLYEVDGGVATLGYRTTGSVNVPWVRDNGAWGVVHADAFNDQPNGLDWMRDGSLVVGGVFTAIGASSIDRVARLVDGTWYSMVGSLNGAVNDVAASKPPYSRFVAIVGSFTSYSGGSVRRALLWEDSGGGLVSEMCTGLNNSALVVCHYRGGEFFVGGTFTADGPGTTPLGYMAWYRPSSPAAWALIGGDGLNNTVRTIIAGPDGMLYVGGDFTETSDSTVILPRIGRYDPNYAEWTALGRGLGGVVRALAFGPDGLLYAGGDFLQDGTGVTQLRYLARWNGISWEEVGGGLDGAVTALASDGEFLYVSGDFTAGSVGLPEYVTSENVRWDGERWLPSDFGGAKLVAYALRSNGDLGVLLEQGGGGGVLSAATTTVTNRGTAETRPMIRISDIGTLYQVSNLTTGQHLFFKALELINEVLYLDFTGETPRFYTDSRADLTNMVVPVGGDVRDFRLAEGDNQIVVYLSTSSGGESAAIRWRNAHWSIDVAARLRGQ